MNATIARKLTNSKRRIERRLDKSQLGECSQPMFTARNIHYDIGDRQRGLSHGRCRPYQGKRAHRAFQSDPLPTPQIVLIAAHGRKTR